MNVTRIQILEGATPGYLDVKEGGNVPLNFSISDIRDVSSRSGMFSKTITLPGTKNNNTILNNYYDVNVVAGTYDLNKKVLVAIVQNGVVIKDFCYLTLTKVKILDNQKSTYGNVEYEVTIKDTLGDFFKDMNNLELTDLTSWENLNHIYNAANVVASYTHTQSNGYKYVLPHISGAGGWGYQLSELMPGIYAQQFWDRIHAQQGYTYTWNDMTANNVQFDKAILPYNGDRKKLNLSSIDADRVTVRNTTTQNYNLTQSATNSSNSSVGNITATQDEVDPRGLYFNSVYTSPYALTNPNNLVYKLKVTWELYAYNTGAFEGTMALDDVPPNTLVDLTTGVRPTFVVRNVTTNSNVATRNFTAQNFVTFGSEVAGESNLIGQPATWQDGEGYINFKGRYKINATTQRLMASGTEDILLSATDISIGDALRLQCSMNSRVVTGSQRLLRNLYSGQAGYSNPPMDHQYRMRITNIALDIAPDANNGLIPGANLQMSEFVPTKIKQADFLKSVYQKYNLYVEVDPTDPKHLIYTSRDKFYDSGAIKDWTYKQCKDKTSDIFFVPEISSKKLTLSYKDDDKDTVATAYKNETKKTYGQVEVTFDNQNIKGSEIKSEIFSPTISAVTPYGAVCPILSPEFKDNLRFLQDGGAMACQTYVITESPGITVSPTTYPYIGMFDRPYNPLFSIEYAQPDYYAYEVGQPTWNNLYTNFWRRTFAQINAGKIWKTYFILNETDIQSYKPNDKIKVGNSMWYINKIVDYNANANTPTLVELLSVEDDLLLPRVGSIVKPPTTGVILDDLRPLEPAQPSKPGGFFTEAIGSVAKQRIDFLTIYNGYANTGTNLGINNTVPDNFSGIIVGNNINATTDGLYTETVAITSDGIQSGNVHIDGSSISIGDMNIEDSLKGIPMVYTTFLTHITNSTLIPGSLYHITDKNYFFRALSTYEVEPTGVRRMPVIKDEFYNTVNASTRGVLKIGRSMAETNRVVWGARVWYKTNPGTHTLTSLPTNPLNPNSNSQGILFSMIPPSDPFHYELGYFTISWDALNDIVYWQRDWKGNILYSNYNTTSNTYYSQQLDYADWGNNRIYNNTLNALDVGYVAYKLLNNSNNENRIYGNTSAGIYQNSNNGAINNNQLMYLIENNRNNGAIAHNSSKGAISGNSNTGNILLNTNLGSINNNTNNSNIQSNSNLGAITSNSNSGAINNNINKGDINNNSNSGPISYNSNTDIKNNSNTGAISYNSNSGTIEYNTFNGAILVNSNNGNIGGSVIGEANYQHSGLPFNATEISYNSNGGSIVGNRLAGLIKYNSNGGDIRLNTNLSSSVDVHGVVVSNSQIVGNCGGCDITSNSNSGSIHYNNVFYRIYGNSNLQLIGYNTCTRITSNSHRGNIVANTNGNIQNCASSVSTGSNNISGNANKGNIQVTFTAANVHIQDNTNNGNISGNKNATVSDPIVNK